MGRQKQNPKQEVLNPVLEAYKEYCSLRDQMDEAKVKFLDELRVAKRRGETYANLSSALGLSTQWLWKFTTYGTQHHKVWNKSEETPTRFVANPDSAA